MQEAVDSTNVRKSIMKEIKDTRIRRGCDIGSDHYLVQSKLKITHVNK